MIFISMLFLSVTLYAPGGQPTTEKSSLLFPSTASKVPPIGYVNEIAWSPFLLYIPIFY